MHEIFPVFDEYELNFELLTIDIKNLSQKNLT